LLTETEISRIESLWVPPEWPDFADEPYAANGHKYPFSHYLERVRRLGLSGGRLIDAGCGTGRWCFALASRFDHVLGFDFTPARAATAVWLKERFGLDQVEFLKADVRHIPAPDLSTDVVYSNSLAVGWVPLEVILAECFRVLKPGGICYIGLNGPGYAYYMAKHSDPKLAVRGRERIYNDISQPFLKPLVSEISPGGPLNSRAREELARGIGPVDLLRAIGATATQINAVERIKADLGPDFVTILTNDLADIISGRKKEFTYATTGRGYEPDELCATARAVGFSRFEWALYGSLSLQPDGSVQKGDSPEAGVSPELVEGRIRVYEALLWKPLAR